MNGTLQLPDNLVEWGQIQLRPGAVTPLPVNVHDTVQKVFTELTVQANLKENMLVNLANGDAVVNIHEYKLRFILRNLVTNANKFTSKGRITIGAGIIGNKVQLLITDTGVGMPLVCAGACS